MLQHSGQEFKLRGSRSKQIIFSNIIDLNNLPVEVNHAKDYYIYAGSLTMLKGADNLLKLINISSEKISFVVVGLPKGEESKKIYKKLGGEKKCYFERPKEP